jgi:hypothetical protein
MNKELVKELYEMSDRYNGRIKELLLLATSEIQKQDLIITELKQSSCNIIEAKEKPFVSPFID